MSIHIETWTCALGLAVAVAVACTPNDPDPSGSGTGTDSAGTAGTEGLDETGTGGPPQVGTCTRYEAAPESGVAWFFHCGTVANEALNRVSVDSNGNALVMLGLRENSSGPAAAFEIEDVMIEVDGSDSVVLTLTPDGMLSTVRTLAGPDDQLSNGVVACVDGHVIAWSENDGEDSVVRTMIERVDGAGAVQWSLELTEPDQLTVQSMDCDPAGNLAVAAGEVLFGVDPSGVITWSRDARVINPDVEFVPGGDFVVSGTFEGSVDLGGGQMSASGGRDTVVARYTPSGDYLWGHQIGPEGDQYSTGLAVAEDGTVAITGRFYGYAEIDGELLTNVNIDAEPDEVGTVYDVFVAQLQPDGTVSSVVQHATMLDDNSLDQVYSDGGLVLLSTSENDAHLHEYDGAMSRSLRDFNGFWPVHAQLDRGPDAAITMGAVVGAGIDIPFAGVTVPGQGSFDVIIARLQP